MFLIRCLWPKAFFSAGGGGDGPGSKSAYFTVTVSVDRRMNKVAKQLDTE